MLSGYFLLFCSCRLHHFFTNLTKESTKQINWDICNPRFHLWQKDAHSRSKPACCRWDVPEGSVSSCHWWDEKIAKVWYTHSVAKIRWVTRWMASWTAKQHQPSSYFPVNDPWKDQVTGFFCFIQVRHFNLVNAVYELSMKCEKSEMYH